MNKHRRVKKYLSFLIAVLLLFTSLPVASGLISSAAGGADLMITKVAASLSTVYADSSVYFYAVVRNVGSKAAPAGSTVRIYRDGFKVEDIELTEELAAGRMKTIRTTGTGTIFFGSHLLSAKLIPAADADSDTSNNYFRSRVLVLDENKPDEIKDPFEDPDYVPTTPGETVGDPETEPLLDNQYTDVDATSGTVSGDAHVSKTYGGYTGSGYISSIKSGSSVTYKYNAPKAGPYVVKIKYANGNGNGNSDTNPLYVYGTISSGDSSATVKLRNSYAQFNRESYRNVSSTGQAVWDSWRYTTAIINLKEGENTITVTGNSGNQFNLDMISFAPAQNAEKGFKTFSFKMKDNAVLDEKGGYVSGLKYDINCEIGDDGIIRAKVPTTVDLSFLVASYTLYNEKDTVTVHGFEQISGVSANNFTNGQYYTVGENTYKVILTPLQDSALPNVFIRFERGEDRDPTNTELKIATDETIDKLFNSTSKSDKDNNQVQCYVTVEKGKESNIINPYSEKLAKDEKMFNLPGLIAIRGNSTLELAKKAYKVKLAKKATLLDMSKGKNWILLASHGDKSMLRQYMGYELGQIFVNDGDESKGLMYSARRHYVNTFIDGKYNGIYLLMESNKLASDRIRMISAEDLVEGASYERYWDDTDVEEIKDEAGNVIDTKQRTYTMNSTDTSGGYMIEFDVRQGTGERDEANVFQDQNGNWYAVKEPDVTDAQKEGARNTVNSVWNAINSGSWSTVTSVIDPYSFADWYIIMDLFKNQDARNWSSIFLTKISDTEAKIEGGPHYQADGKGRVYMGPIWDFDISSGNIDYSAGDGTAQSTTGTSGYYIKTGLWWGRLWNYGEFRTILRERYNYLLNQLGDGGISGKIQEIADYITPAVNENFEKWGIQTYVWPEPRIYGDYNSYVNDFKSWMNTRVNWIKNDNFNS